MRKKIKYQSGITKFLCQQQAERNKKDFGKDLSKPENYLVLKSHEINFEIFSFSGASGFQDQILSIYSLLFYAGVPIKWTIYSDKSYTEEQKEIFKKLFPFVTVKYWDTYNHFNDNKLVKEYLAISNMAKKLNVILGHDYEHQTIYLDSDIVFYKNISAYLSSHLLSSGLWYVPDTLGDVNNYFSIERESIYPLNAGLLVLNNTFDFGDIYKYFENLKGNYNYFSEQSSFEFAFRKQGANMLDPRQFIIDTSDQFDFSLKYYPENIAMRHYTGPVRHKMWQKGWKWHFIY